MRRVRSLSTAAVLSLIAGLALAQPPLDKKLTLDIAPQSIGDALNELARQTGVQVAVYSQIGEGFTSPRISGTLTAREALAAILKGTGLEFEFTANTVIVMRKNAVKDPAAGGQPAAASPQAAASQLHLAQTVVQSREETATDPGATEDSKGVPEILVKGKRSLNADIERTEDAPQPYVIFEREEIERSQATNLEDFLRTRLPMNTTTTSNAQSSLGTTSSIDLRGLGVDQTLILVDGRRMPTAMVAGAPSQPDLNGIALSSIERIEVLPSTAGGIYGGGATGGVVNVILRRDYRGIEGKATYANTFDTDTGNLRLEVSGGFNLEGGRTRVTFAATRSEGNTLLVGDRDFHERGIALQVKNNPVAIVALATPPLGATVNIRSATGGPLVLKPQYGGASLGQPNTHVPLGYAGPASDNGAALVANAGHYNLHAPAGVNGLERGLVRVPSVESASVNLRREFGQHLEVFLDLARFGNDGVSYNGVVPDVAALLPTAPNNPFLQPIVVRFPTPGLSFGSHSESSILRGTAGLIARLPAAWTTGLDIGWSRSRWRQSDTQVALNVLANCVLSQGIAPNVDPDGAGPQQPCKPGDLRPALNALQEGNTFPVDYSPYLLPSPNFVIGPADSVLKNATFRLSGPVAQLPGGALNLSLMAERREEAMERGYLQTINPSTEALIYQGVPDRYQNVDSWYVEARAPLISSANSRPFMRELQLQASVRRDAYKTGAYAANYVPVSGPGAAFPPMTQGINRFASVEGTVGLRYSPSEDLALRASYGTGFLPPSVTQITSTERPFTGSLGLDRQRGDSPTSVGVPITWVSGGNPDLKPEDSTSFSAGLILTPRLLSGLRLSIDYTHIEKVNEIQTPTPQFLLDNERLYPDRIVRGDPRIIDPINYAPPIVRFDSSYINIAKSALEAYDVQLDYVWQTLFGDFRWYALASWQPRLENQALSTSPVVDSVGYTSGPLEWRGNLGIDWRRGPASLSWNAQYYHSYLVYAALPLPLTTGQVQARENTILGQGSDTIPSQLYHDVVGSYSFDGSSRFAGGVLANSRISLGIQNLFGRRPPVLAVSTPGGNSYSHHGNPLMRRYTLSFQKNFGS